MNTRFATFAILGMLLALAGCQSVGSSRQGGDSLFRGQSPNDAPAAKYPAPATEFNANELDIVTPGSTNQTRQPMAVSGGYPSTNAAPTAQVSNYQPPAVPADTGYGNTNQPAYTPPSYGQPAAQPAAAQPVYGQPVYTPPAYGNAPTYGAPASSPNVSNPATGYGAPAPNGYGAPGNGAPTYGAPGYSAPTYGNGAIGSGAGIGPGFGNGAAGAPFDPLAPQTNPVPPVAVDPTADIDVILQETQTGRFQFGVGVNSDAGVTGQIVIDERNFDWAAVPRTSQDWMNGTAFRGAGQGFRIEAMPGNQVQRYLVSFTEPYLFGFSPISLNLSAFFYNRRFFDWDEERLGGRMALGYRLSHDLSLSAALRAEKVDISNPRIVGVPELDAAVGGSDFFSGRLQLTHDTRDIPFFPTEGHYFELGFEQAFGSFDYPRAELDYRKYFLVSERPDGSGRHTLAYSFRLGFSGAQTPIFENYFSGGYSTMRGFDFRGASPIVNTVTVGGKFRFLGAVEYFFPITADDMVKGVVFCDFGTTERDIAIDWDNYRVSPGFGLRLNIPALGPAPLALDLAVPIARAPTDNIQNFSFFFGFAR